MKVSFISYEGRPMNEIHVLFLRSELKSDSKGSGDNFPGRATDHINEKNA
jgi:hypothetical protein